MKTIEGLSIYEAEKQIREYLHGLWVSKPKEARLNTNKPTKEDIENYNNSSKQYHLILVDYENKKSFYDSESLRLWDLLHEKVKEDSGLNDIPEKYRDKVYSYACREGHSSGYIEIYNILCELVDIFN
jgi:trehalose-6-phosphate synthase